MVQDDGVDRAEADGDDADDGGRVGGQPSGLQVFEAEALPGLRQVLKFRLAFELVVLDAEEGGDVDCEGQGFDAA